MLALSGACTEALRILDLEVRVEGAPPRGVALVVANHVSYLDPVAIASVVPCVPIGKAEVARWPVLGAVGAATGVLFVARHERGSRFGVVRAAEGAFQAGLPVLNFPEGTTTAGDRVLPLRPALFGSAIRLGVPVAPVAVRYDPPELAWIGDATFLPHLARLLRRHSARVRLAFGAPLSPAAYPSAVSLAEAARARLSDLLEEATPWRRIRP